MRHFATSLSALGLVLALGAPASAALADHDTRLMHLLGHPELPLTRAMLDEIGVDDRGEALIAVMQDASLRRYHRARATVALAQYDSPNVRVALDETIAGGIVTDVEVQVYAVTALTHLLGVQALMQLETLLGNDNPELRAAAVRNLSGLRVPEARALLEQRLQGGVEQERWILKTIQRELQRWRPTPKEHPTPKE